MAMTDEIKQETKKLKDMSFKKKIEYIWEYYKIPIIGGIAAAILLTVFIRDYIDGRRPVYLDALMINSNFSFDRTNTVYDDFAKSAGIDLDEYQMFIDMSMRLNGGDFNEMELASQSKLMAMYAAHELDAMIGPVDIMEGPADADCYADLTTILSKEQMDELSERGYEFYTYPGPKAPEFDYLDDEDSKAERENFVPYIAGVYLDNSSYLNNQGDYGAYNPPTSEGERPIFTISITAPHPEHAVEFLMFLCE